MISKQAITARNKRIDKVVSLSDELRLLIEKERKWSVTKFPDKRIRNINGSLDDFVCKFFQQAIEINGFIKEANDRETAENENQDRGNP